MALGTGHLLVAGLANLLAHTANFRPVGKGHIFGVFQVMAGAVVTKAGTVAQVTLVLLFFTDGLVRDRPRKFLVIFWRDAYNGRRFHQQFITSAHDRHCVAKVAFHTHRFRLAFIGRCDVVAIVAAETTQRIGVAGIVGVGAIVQLHIREVGLIKDLLQACHRLVNIGLGHPAGGRIRIAEGIDGRMGRLYGFVLAREQGHRLGADRRQIARDQAVGDGVIYHFFRVGDVMGGAVVAVDAIQPAQLARFPGFFHKILLAHAYQVAGKIFLHAAIFLLHTDPANALALAVHRYVVHLTLDVPVNALAFAGHGIKAAHLEDEGGLAGGVGLIIQVVHLGFGDVVLEGCRCMAVLAGFSGGAQVVHRAKDRPAIVVGDGADQLAGAIDLGLDERHKTFTHVAMHTSHIAVRRLLETGHLRIHRMADRSTEGDALRPQITLNAADHQPQTDHNQYGKTHH